MMEMTNSSMAILHPLLCVVALQRAVILILHYYSVRQSWQSLFGAFFYLTNAWLFLILSLTSGASPIFDIDQFRFVIVIIGVLMLSILSASNFYAWRDLNKKSQLVQENG